MPTTTRLPWEAPEIAAARHAYSRACGAVRAATDTVRAATVGTQAHTHALATLGAAKTIMREALVAYARVGRDLTAREAEAARRDRLAYREDLDRRTLQAANLSDLRARGLDLTHFDED